ncbi:MAG: efflux RND transporter permease subunit, partial [Gammaproteobacteria bacterium]|nr:efflux RND transporter permease subunit [Gammaproteobacteria bacterium]
LILALTWQQASDPQMAILSRLAQSLNIRLANVSGTEETDIYGEIEEEVLVALNPARTAAANLTAAQVGALIRAADTKSAAGRLRNDTTDMLVEVDAELDSPERIARIPLKKTPAGTMLRVSDIGEVRKYQVDPPATLAYHGAERAIFIKTKMAAGLQIGDWIDNAMAVVDAFAQELPAGIGLEVVYNQNDYTAERMGSLLTNLMFALAIVMLMLVWLMGIRSALTVGVALPLAAGMVMIFMRFMDIPLHQMSITGLIISLGLLIDNAIVVVEDYKLRRRDGNNIPDAIGKAVRHLVIPLGASTATTIFAFLPIAFAPGAIGDFTGTIGLSVAFAVASSFLLSMTVVPAVAGFLERRWPDQGGQRWWQTGYSNEQLARYYQRTIQSVLRKPLRGVALGCVLPLIGYLLAPTLTMQFFPPVDRNQFQVQISLPAQSSIWETRRAVERAEAVLRNHPDVVDTHWTLGEGAPRVFYNVMVLNEGVSSFAAGWVDTTSAGATLEMLNNLQAELSLALPNSEVLALPFEQGPPIEAPIALRVVGPDLNQLRILADELRLYLSEIEEVTYTRASLTAAEPKLVFVPNENPTAAAGMTTGDLTRQLNQALIGISAGSVQEANTSLNVRVRVENQRRDDIADLTTLPLINNSGGSVPLNQLGSWQLRPSATTIDRYQGERISEVLGFITPFALPASVMAKFEERLAASDFVVPAGYRLEIGGESEQRSESMGHLMSSFIVFAIAMAAVVILSLNSFRQAGIIAVVGILSFGLALFGVRLFGYPLGYMALIGSLGMVGLAINGAIIVMSALKADEKVNAGDLTRAGEVVVDATRHIVSTTLTTIGGFLPLILAGGTFWPPLATAIAGGVAGSAIIALYTVPTVYMMIVRSSKKAPVRALAPVEVELAMTGMASRLRTGSQAV